MSKVLLRAAAVLGAMTGLFGTPPEARACDGPPGYYRVVNGDGEEPVVYYADHSPMPHMLGALKPGDIVFSEGTRAPESSGEWQAIRLGQVEAWMHPRNLWRTLPRTMEKTSVPIAGQCGASEPLWSMIWDERRIRVSLFPGRYEVPLQSVQSGREYGAALLRGAAPGTSVAMIYSDQKCLDQNGVAQGWGSVSVVLNGDGQEQLLTGCCAAAMDAFVRR